MHNKFISFFKEKITVLNIQEKLDEKPIHLKVLKNQTDYSNENKLKKTNNAVLNSLVLSLCSKVIKNHSQPKDMIIT